MKIKTNGRKDRERANNYYEIVTAVARAVKSPTDNNYEGAGGRFIRGANNVVISDREILLEKSFAINITGHRSIVYYVIITRCYCEDDDDYYETVVVYGAPL